MNKSGDKYLKPIYVKSEDKVIVYTIDVYDVINAWSLTGPGRQHAIKKLLQAGKRHSKSEIQDLEEAIDAIQRDIDYLKLTNMDA